jgi:hypothetical protein
MKTDKEKAILSKLAMLLYAKQAASSPAWQRSEGKNPDGGLNAKGRASYKRETGGTLKAPVTESNPSGERAKRQNSFCSRMCGMKRKNTGSKAQSDPDSRINKSLRKWNCKCGEDHSSLFEKVACTLEEKKLEKEAMTLSYMKNAIRAARASGIPILRNEAQLAAHANEHYDSVFKKVPFIGDRLQRRNATQFARTVQDGGPAAFPGYLGNQAKFVYLPRSFTAEAGQHYSPRATLLHELGHLEHHAEDPLTLSSRLKRYAYSPVNNASLTNLEETIANNNAINGMRAANVPEQWIDIYKAKSEAPFYNTYARRLNRTAEKPTGHMNIGQYFVHQVKQKGSNTAKNIFSKIRGVGNQPKAAAPIPSSTKPAPTAAEKNLAFEKIRDALANRTKKVFEPLPERPTYTNPIAQEFNVPYSVDAPRIQKQGGLLDLLKTATGRCWEGYEPVPGKEPYSNDSCRPKKDKKKSTLEKEATAWKKRLRTGKLSVDAFDRVLRSSGLSSTMSPESWHKSLSDPRYSKGILYGHRERGKSGNVFNRKYTVQPFSEQEQLDRLARTNLGSLAREAAWRHADSIYPYYKAHMMDTRAGQGAQAVKETINELSYDPEQKRYMRILQKMYDKREKIPTSRKKFLSDSSDYPKESWRGLSLEQGQNMIDRTGQVGNHGPQAVPDLNTIASPIGVGQPITRHEISHLVDHNMPQSQRLAVLKELHELLKRNPEVMRGILRYKDPTKAISESFAQLIGSRGNSNSAKRFTDSYVAAAKNSKIWDMQQILPKLLERDPSGRDAAVVSQLIRRYDLKLPDYARHQDGLPV